MDTLSYLTGGFPMSVDRLDEMQECWKQIGTALAGVVSGGGEASFIVSGCGSGFSKEGWVSLKGELLPFVADGTGAYVTPVESVTASLTYEDGESKEYRKARYAHLTPSKGTGSVAVVDFATDARSIATLFDLIGTKADTTRLDSLGLQVANNTATLAAMQGDIDLNTEGLDALKVHFVPKGTVIMWGKALPLTATTKDEVIAGMGDAYGYLPCGNYATTADMKKAAPAWNAYFKELGLKGTFPSSGKSLNFSSIFQIPDLQARFPLGAGSSSAGTTYALGKQGGEEKHTLTTAEMPSHTHSLKDYYYADAPAEVRTKGASNYDTITTNNKVGSGKTDNDNSGLLYYSHRTDAAGSGEGHNNMPPYYALNFLIKMI